jgi:hypothetical protein
MTRPLSFVRSPNFCRNFQQYMSQVHLSNLCVAETGGVFETVRSVSRRRRRKEVQVQDEAPELFVMMEEPWHGIIQVCGLRLIGCPD